MPLCYHRRLPIALWIAYAVSHVVGRVDLRWRIRSWHNDPRLGHVLAILCIVSSISLNVSILELIKSIDVFFNIVNYVSNEPTKIHLGEVRRWWVKLRWQGARLLVRRVRSEGCRTRRAEEGFRVTLLHGQGALLLNCAIPRNAQEMRLNHEDVGQPERFVTIGGKLTNTSKASIELPGRVWV
jgi:hypothetical protein